MKLSNSFSYLTNRKQYVSINGFDSDLNTIYYNVPQGPALGLLLFLIYINHLHNAIKFPFPFHFADYTCLLNTRKSTKDINKK